MISAELVFHTNTHPDFASVERKVLIAMLLAAGHTVTEKLEANTRHPIWIENWMDFVGPKARAPFFSASNGWAMEDALRNIIEQAMGYEV